MRNTLLVNLRNIKNIIQEKRLPWFIEKRIRTGKNMFCYYKNRGIHFFRRPGKNKTKITFNCGFHGETGGVFAIASIANLLAKKFQIDFVSFPGSNYNPLLDTKIHLVKTPDMNSDLFVCDIECQQSFLETLKTHKKPTIISCHGLLNELHGLDPDHVKKSLSFADTVHFVSLFQQDAFQLESTKFEVIPNTTRKINKTCCTNNVGCVGNLNDARKNVTQSVNIALDSKADAIHLWSMETDIWKHPRVVTHGWETDKEKIYNSFDVLVFMSRLETFGLVVIEAMSAGIPCLLSSIPAFEQFRDCPGVTILSADNKETASDLLNEILENKNMLRQAMCDHFDHHYSEAAISEKWFLLVSNLLGQVKGCHE